MWNVGQLINGRYCILAAGAQGEGRAPFRALDQRSGKACLLDFIPLTPRSDSEGEIVSRPDIIEQKLRELNHPLIVLPEAIEETEGGVVVVSDSLGGLTLEELLRAEAPLPLSRACFIIRQAAIALEASHHSGIIHGDLKPSDILLVREEGQERVKVLGFGIFGAKQHAFVNMARLASDAAEPLLGDPNYVSPEQALGTSADALDGRSDLYSLGVIFFRALSGRLPFERESAMGLLLAQVFTAPPRLAEFIEIPEVVDSLVTRCLAKRREDRPASATALIDQLGPWEAHEATAAEPAQVEAERPAPAIKEAPTAPLDFVSPAQQPVLQVELAEPKAPATFISDFGTPARASAVDFTAAVMPAQALQPAPVNQPAAEEWPLLPAEPAESETPRHFVADLETAVQAGPRISDPSTPGRASPPAAAQAPLDITLDAARSPVLDQKKPARQYAVEGAASLFSQTSGKPRNTLPPSGGGAKWIWAAVILLLLIAGACGWLAYTGRTYWFRPQFVKQRVSSLISGSRALLLEEGNQDSDSSAPAQAVTSPASQAAPAPSAASSQPASPPAASAGASAQTGTEPPAASLISPRHAEAPLSQGGRTPEQAGTHSSPPPAAALTRAAPQVKSIARTRSAVRPKTAVRSASAAPEGSGVSGPSVSTVQDAIEQGESYFERGDYDDAIRVYRMGLVQDPLNTRLRDDIARAKRAKAAEAKYLGQ